MEELAERRRLGDEGVGGAGGGAEIADDAGVLQLRDPVRDEAGGDEEDDQPRRREELAQRYDVRAAVDEVTQRRGDKSAGGGAEQEEPGRVLLRRGAGEEEERGLPPLAQDGDKGQRDERHEGAVLAGDVDLMAQLSPHR